MASLGLIDLARMLVSQFLNFPCVFYQLLCLKF